MPMPTTTLVNRGPRVRVPHPACDSAGESAAEGTKKAPRFQPSRVAELEAIVCEQVGIDRADLPTWFERAGYELVTAVLDAADAVIRRDGSGADTPPTPALGSWEQDELHAAYSYRHHQAPNRERHHERKALRAALCEELRSRASNDPEWSLYLIACGSDGPIKIGVALDPGKRLREFQTAHHEDLHIVDVFPGGRSLESALHRMYRTDRIRGEWFRRDGALDCRDLLTEAFA